MEPTDDLSRPAYHSAAQADWDDQHRRTQAPRLRATCARLRPCPWIGYADECALSAGSGPRTARPHLCPRCGGLAIITPAPAPTPNILLNEGQPKPYAPFSDFAFDAARIQTPATCNNQPIRRAYHLTPFQVNLIVDCLAHRADDPAYLWNDAAARLATVLRAINHADSDASDH